jgi:hypothetical protein
MASHRYLHLCLANHSQLFVCREFSDPKPGRVIVKRLHHATNNLVDVFPAAASNDVLTFPEKHKLVGTWKQRVYAIRPDPLVDTQWSGDHKDRYPDSLLDFAFVAGAAKEFVCTSQMIMRDGDFPDDKSTSDHRPIELVVCVPK